MRRMILAMATLFLMACGSTDTGGSRGAGEGVPTSPTGTVPCLAGSQCILVFPTLHELQPVQAAPNQAVHVSGGGGYLRTVEGSGYDESARSFALTLDGQSIGRISCYIGLCEGSFTVPAGLEPGTYVVATEGGSQLTLTVVARPEASSGQASPPAITPPGATATLPSSGGIAATIPVGQPPQCQTFVAGSVAVGAGSVWVTNAADGTVVRIDPATNQIVANIQVVDAGMLGCAGTAVGAIAADDTAVWVGAEYGTKLVRIDPATNQVVASIPVTAGINEILAIGHGAVWVKSYVNNAVVRIDPATNLAVAEIPVSDPRDIAITSDAVWVLQGIESSVGKLDPTSNAVVATIPIAQQWGDRLLVSGEHLLVVTTSALVQLDPATSEIVAIITYPVGGNDSVNPLVATTGNGQMWICRCTGAETNMIWQLDLTTQRWTAQIPAPGVALNSWLVYLDDSLWGLTVENTVVRVKLSD